MDFLNMDLPPEDENSNKFEGLNNWFDFMNRQLEKIEKSQQTYEINNLLNENGIESIK